jgi:EAL domain-containing protein (putative c-di-GMP-specific phosphodiesterase class I)/FixJ family two-component response regulator
MNAMDRANHAALVVEDSAIQRAYAVDLLRQLGFGEILEATNGRQALDVLAGGTPVALVITDLEMPEMDGIELIRHLSERGMAHNLIVTSSRDPRMFEIVERIAAEDGCVRLLGTLAKPLQMGDLEGLLERIEGPRRSGRTAPPSRACIGEIESALRRREFIPYFQPKISLSTGAITGIEALARWRHPEHGVLTPDHFIPVIEGTPHMEALTLRIAEEACRALYRLRREGMPALTAAVNLSADNLGDRKFIDRLANLVGACGLSCEAMVWEVTETMFMHDVAESLANLAHLGLMGFGLAMDDYGVGYSSIQQFSRCPFTELKIDRSFVNEATRRPNRRVILESAIEMGHRLNVATVAEGVETREDFELLRSLGCDFAQGFLVARPMSLRELRSWVRAWCAGSGSLFPEDRMTRVAG